MKACFRRGVWVSAAVISAAVLLGWLSVVARSWGRGAEAIPHRDLLRFHVLANSDAPRDQAVKRLVRDAVLERTDALFAKVRTAVQARAVASRSLAAIEGAANDVLASAGEPYKAHATVGDFDFPIKRYGDLVLPAGSYPAVRILLGDAQGQNWWCVLFPPLCFRDFDSGFAMSVARKVSAKKSLSTYGRKLARTTTRPTFRFTLRSLEKQSSPRGAQFVWRKTDAKAR